MAWLVGAGPTSGRKLAFGRVFTRQSSDGCASTFVGGRSLTEQGKSSFYFDIKITDETNTKDNKARHIREAFDGFAGILGNLYALSCIHVRDVRAASCGYGAHTQEYRYHRG